MPKVTSIEEFANKRIAATLQLEQERATYQSVSTAIDAYIMGRVSAGAFTVFRFIFNMTFNRGKQQNGITYEEFVNGVYVHHQLIQTGLRVTENSIAKYIKELNNSGLIKVSKVITGSTYPYSVYEINFKNIESLAMLKLSKKFRGKTSQESTVKNTVGQLQNLQSPNTNTYILPKGNKRDSHARTFNTISQATEETLSRVRRSRAAKLEKQNSRPMHVTMKGVKAAWETCVLKHYPTVPPIAFSPKQFAIFKNKVQPVLVSSSLNEFFDWVVSSWQDIRASKFAWLRRKGKDVAVAPSLYELMGYWKIFVSCYAEYKAVAVTNTMKMEKNQITPEHEQLVQTQHELAERTAESLRLKKRLRIAEGIANAPSNVASLPKMSLIEKRQQTQKDYDAAMDDGELPEWKE